MRMFTALCNDKDFEKSKSHGVKVVKNTLILSYLLREEPKSDSLVNGTNLRVGLKVLKKVGNAPFRNRIKRVSREAIRIVLKKNQNFKTPLLDVVVIVRPKFSTRPNFEERFLAELRDGFCSMLKSYNTLPK